MINRRMVLSVVALVGFIGAGGIAVGKNAHHNNGHAMLGDKLNHNGKHEIAKIGNASVTAEVNNKKVVNMSAGGLPARRVKSRKKMVDFVNPSVRLAANGNVQFAQAEYVSYGYCFDSGTDEHCYWYSADDVLLSESWVEYAPA